PIVLRLSPPRNGAKPAMVAPTKFNTPVVEARSDAGTTSKAHAAWLPEMKPTKKPKPIAAMRVSLRVGAAPSQKMHGLPSRKPKLTTQKRPAFERRGQRSAISPPAKSPSAV